MVTTPAECRAIFIDVPSMVQELVMGLYTSTESKKEFLSRPPTAYNNPSNATTPILIFLFKYSTFQIHCFIK